MEPTFLPQMVFYCANDASHTHDWGRESSRSDELYWQPDIKQWYCRSCYAMLYQRGDPRGDYTTTTRLDRYLETLDGVMDWRY